MNGSLLFFAEFIQFVLILTLVICFVFIHMLSVCTGLPRSWKVLESPGFFGYNFHVLESPGKWVWSWKVLEI